jgi:lantibiotic modifying enzyme
LTNTVSGQAGTILALSKLYNLSRNCEVLELIEKIGSKGIWSRNFLDSVEEHGIEGDAVLSGMSHGLSGMSLACSRAYEIIRKPIVAEAADLFTRIESARFEPKQNNWPDLRRKANSHVHTQPCQWCHGAAGIGIARLTLSPELGESELRDLDIQRAVEAVRLRALRPVDHVCCGNFGLIEFLFDAAKYQSNSELGMEVLKKAANIILSARKNGNYQWPVGEDKHNFGFFNGLSGIGYSTLRLSSQSKLPSVLSMQ